MKTGVGCCIVVLSLVLVSQTATVYSQSKQDLLELAQTGARSTAASIHSGRGTVNVHIWTLNKYDGVTEAEVEYHVLFAGTRFRISATRKVLQMVRGEGEKDKGGALTAGTLSRVEYALDDNGLTTYEPDKKSAHVSSNQTPAGIDPLPWGAISPSACGLYPIPTAGRQCVDASRQSPAGDNLISITTSGTEGVFFSRHEYVVDADKGFSTTQMVVRGHDDQVKEDALLDKITTTVRDYGNGIWGPGECTKVSYRPNTAGQMRKSSVKVISYAPDFIFNSAVAKSDLSLDLPSGTTVYNEDLDAVFNVP